MVSREYGWKNGVQFVAVDRRVTLSPDLDGKTAVMFTNGAVVVLLVEDIK